MSILISGFFGEGNLGDDAILDALCRNISDEHHIFVTAGKRPVTRAATVRRRGLSAWPSYIQTLKCCRKAVFSGGILQDWSFEGVTFYALRIIAASVMGCEPSLWGAGIGPLRRTGTRLIARRALKRVKTAWLRDESSLSEFNALSSNNGHLGTDWTWFFDIPRCNVRENGAMLLNLRQWPDDGWHETVAHQLRHIERPVIGLSAREGDKRLIREIAPQAVIIQPESFTDFARACTNASFGLATRYHAALAMLRTGLPVKVLAYDRKVAELAEAAGIQTIAENNISGFKSAVPEFFKVNRNLFTQMQKCFKDYLQREF